MSKQATQHRRRPAYVFPRRARPPPGTSFTRIGPMFAQLALAFQTVVAAGPATPPREGVIVPPAPKTVPAPTARGATAMRATTPPQLGGADAEAIWRDAPPITQFRQHDPVEDGDPRDRTEARVASDERYLYVFVRAFDPSPDSVMAFL